MSAHPHYLPVQMTATIGRTHEIDTASALLRQRGIRLLTLTGPGGVGKTRLGLEIAREVRADFRDGVYFVSLAPVREGEQVLSVIAQTIGVEEVVDHPLSERLREHLYDKHLLLMLDNFEHVLGAAPLLADLLFAAPHLKVLATSREILHLYGEHEFAVLPLALPDLSQHTHAEDIPSSAAMTLFVERAQAVKPSFTLTSETLRQVAEICIQLDGLPLAIELAAARVKLLTTQAILDRLQSRLSFLTGGARNLPVRQQTLRNTLDWSYHLLDEREQCFFRRLGVLVANWTLAAAEAVGIGEGEEIGTPLDLLTSLVDKSFVRVVEDASGEMRFMLLETIREYALDRLVIDTEREEAQRRHAQFYLSLAEEAEQYLYGKEQRFWLVRLDRETANLWAAMRWVIEHKEVVLGMRLASALIGFLHFRSSLSEGRNWFEEVLALDGAAQPNVTRVRVLYGAGLMASMRNDLVLMRLRLKECETLAKEIGDWQGQILSLEMFALLELHQGNYETARGYAEKGTQILQKTGDRWYRGVFHSLYGKIECKQCNFEQARVRFHVGLMLLREVGDLRNQADVFGNLGGIMRIQGKLKTAHFFYMKSLQLFQEIGDRWSQAACLNGIGDIMRLQGNYVEAQARFEESLALTTLIGNKQEKATALTGLGQLALYQSDMLQSARYLKESLRLTKEIEHTSRIAVLLLALGDLERYRGNCPTATTYYEQSLALTRTMNDTFSMAGALFGQGDIARMQHDNTHACILLKQSLQLSWNIGDRLGLAASLETFAWFCHQIHLPERATQFLGTAEALRDWLQIPLAPTFLATHEQEVSALRRAIGETAFNESWSYGRTMTLKLALSMVARIPIPEQSNPMPENPTPVYPAGLTAREVDVLRLLATGLPDARIAEQLVVSPRTVNTHLRSIYAKINVSSRSAATRFAFEHKLV